MRAWGCTEGSSLLYVKVLATFRARTAKRVIRMTDRARSEELVLDVMRAQLQVEEARAQSLNARGLGLVGFGSVILSLLTLAASSDLRASGGLPETAKYLLVGALVLLIVAVTVVVFFVLRPKTNRDLTACELLELASDDVDRIRETLINRLKEAIERHREINDTKARGFFVAGLCLSVAMLGSAITGMAALN